MKFKVLPTVIALFILVVICVLTSSYKAAVDGVDKMGYPFVFYFKFEGKSLDPGALRNYFSYTLLIADIIVAFFFIAAANILFPLVLNKNRLKQTAQ